MKLQILKKIYVWQVLVVLIADLIFFGLVNPNKVNSLFLIAGFILLGLNIYVIMRLVGRFLTKIGFKVKNGRKIALFSAIFICLLLAMQSIGQLSVRDFVIIVFLAVFFYIYITHIRPKTLT